MYKIHFEIREEEPKSIKFSAKSESPQKIEFSAQENETIRLKVTDKLKLDFS